MISAGGGRDGGPRTPRLALFAALLGLALVLHVVESWFPPPLPVPGAKLGLANVISLVGLVILGLPAALGLAALRAVLGSLISGSFLSFGFLLSFGAALASVTAMWLLSATGKGRFSLVGLSLGGALVHNLTQLGLAAVIVRQIALFGYLPYMLLGSLPTGALTGLAATYALRARGAALATWLRSAWAGGGAGSAGPGSTGPPGE
jgi:heptaprenyl diphosphate synthase